MKHTLNITLVLLLIFLTTQLIGLGIVNQYIDHSLSSEKGSATFKSLPYNIERPELEQKTAFLYIFLAILIGTGFVLLIIKFGQKTLWKLWFFFGVTITLSIAFASFIPELSALILGIIFAAWKTFRPNIYIHNLTELFVYGGLAAIFVPLLNILSVIILLILISGYDAYAVWKSKHMVDMATFQADSQIFAGILLGYKPKQKGIEQITTAKLPTKSISNKEMKTAMLGGGDIGFPLIFAGVILKNLIIIYPLFLSFLLTSIVSLCATIALMYLFLYAKKDTFYPAMPFITVGCLIGYGLVWLVQLLI